MTFQELERRIAALAAGLEGLGARGRIVAWVLPNAPVAIELSMALARVGAVSAPLNGRLSADEMAYVLTDSGAEVLVADTAALERALEMRERVDTLTTVVVDGAEAPSAVIRLPDLRASAEPRELPGVADDGLAMLLYTSGTTGFPKGVMRSHRANAWNVVNSALGSPRGPDDVELFNLPAFGIGFLHFAIPALLGGATVVLDDAFAADRAWTLLAGEAVTHTFLAPTMISAMLAVEGQERVELTCLRTLYTAYEFPERLRQRALERFGDVFIYMYGLTEAQLTCTRPGELTAKPGSVGGAMGAMRIRVLDEAGSPLPMGAVGEIALEGPATMDGYHHRPDETARSLRDGWLLTGDLGFIDEDGDLHYAGRSKEMIKTGGFSVDPREVERALLALDRIGDAAVIGVPDEHWGEMVVAFVVPAGDGAAMTESETIDACRGILTGYKLPKRVLVLDALPVNATGKVERDRLRERFAGS